MKDKVVYIAVGTVSTTLNIAIFSLLKGYLDINVLNIISWFITVIVSYVLLSIFVNDNSFNKLLKFFSSRVLTGVLDFTVIGICSLLLFDYLIICKVLCTLVVIVINYFFANIIFFRYEKVFD